MRIHKHRMDERKGHLCRHVHLGHKMSLGGILIQFKRNNDITKNEILIILSQCARFTHFSSSILNMDINIYIYILQYMYTY